VLKTFSQPNPESLQKVCRRHPSACAPAALVTAATTGSHGAPAQLNLAARLRGG
jgi:hypothetical protein